MLVTDKGLDNARFPRKNCCCSKLQEILRFFIAGTAKKIAEQNDKEQGASQAHEAPESKTDSNASNDTKTDTKTDSYASP